MSKFQIASMVATGALFTLQGCNDDKPGLHKSCGDFTSQGQKACVADGNGKCQWADKGKAVCEPNSKYNDYFDKHEDVCKKYGGSMQYTFKSKCSGNTLKTIDWNEAKELTGEQQVTFLSFDRSDTEPKGYLVDRCVGTITYAGDMNNVNVEVTETGGACRNGQNTVWTEKDFKTFKVVHKTNDDACTKDGCAVDSTTMKCVEPGVICESANLNAGKCSTQWCEMKNGASSDMGGVPACFVTDKSKMCDTFTSDAAQYCEKTDKQTCVTPHAHNQYGGMCTMNGQDAANKTCVLLNGDLKTTSGADLASNLCTFKPSTDGECYGQL